MAPIEAFLSIEASSGVLLVLVAAVALVWANSPYGHWYTALWHTVIALRVGPFAIERDLHFWINDGAMAVFFFVVGLEIRREIHGGELSEWRRAALPLAAALGGMLVPAVIYAVFNHRGPASHGWAVPVATDIAFAVGVMALLGKCVPPAARVLLLALAVVDDVGGIVVIALFYSSGVVWSGVLVALAGVAAILLLQAFGARRPWLYFVPAVILWGGMLRSGIHPTLAGVIVGLLTPVRAWLGRGAFSARVREHLSEIDAAPKDGAHAVLDQLDAINEARREAVSPVDRLQHAFHGTVAYLVMPLFALANAGVKLSASTLELAQRPIVLGVMLGLAVGKPIGITLGSWLAVRLRVAILPKGLRWSHVSLVGMLGGVGFTVSLFIATLAFSSGAALDAAKSAILVASTGAGLLSLLFGRMVLRPEIEPGAAQTESEAEQATDK
jgi:NhaA family Na+:H+ antiporter